MKVVFGLLGFLILILGFLNLPFVIFLFSFMAGLITLLGFLVYKIILERQYPYVVRIWEKRYDSPYIKAVERARKVKHKDRYVLETTTGRKIPFKGSNKIVLGKKTNFYDCLEIGTNQYQTILVDLEEAKTKIVPDNDIRFLADTTMETKLNTEPPITRLEKALPIVSIAITLMFIGFMLIMFMQYYPQFVNEISQTMKANIDAFNHATERFMEFVNNKTVCQPQNVPPKPPF